MILQLSLSIGLLAGLASGQVRPPNYSPDRLPETSFTCEDKVSGSYYADVEASCQLFHVCVQVSEYEFQDFHFLCPNDTVFDQQHLVCTNWFDVDCQQSLTFFPHDFAFDKGRPEDYHDYTDYKNYDQPDYEYADVDSDRGTQTFLGFSQPSPSGLRGGGRGRNQGGDSPENSLSTDYYDAEDEDVRGGQQTPPRGTPEAGLGLINPPIATTAIPLGFTTTRRPPHGSPRVKSNLRNKHQQGGTGRPRLPPPLQEESPRNNPFDNPPFISADGRKPRVKANINNQRIISGNSQKKGKSKKQGSKKVELDRSQFSKIDFVEPSAPHAGAPATRGGFAGPEVRPDGRLPRVKANVRAKERQQGPGTTPRPAHRVTPAGTFESPRPSFQANPAVSRVSPTNIFTSPRPSFESTPAVPNFSPGNSFTSPNPFNFTPRPTPAVPDRRPGPSSRPSFSPGPSSRPNFSPGPTSRPEENRRPGPSSRPNFSPGPSSRPNFSPGPSSRPNFSPGPSSRPNFSPGPSSRPNFSPGPSSSPNLPGLSFRPKSEPFIPRPTPAVPSNSFSPLPPPSRPSRPRPSNQFGPGSGIQPGSRDPQKPRFPKRPAPGIQQAFPSSTPLPQHFTATPQPAVPTPQSPNRFPFQPATATSSPFAFSSPQPSQPSARPAVPQRPSPPSFDHSPSNPPILQRNRNRFGSRPSGRPRVKANELAQQSQGAQAPRARFRESPRSKTGGSIRQKTPKGIKFKTIADLNNEIEEEKGKCLNPFHCPPTKPAGGRRPRVKSNIKARKRNFWNPRKQRVIKRRKQVKLNRKLWENVRQGRKHRGGDASAGPLDNRVDNEPIKASAPLDIRAGGAGPTTPDPISSLQRLVASKARHGEDNEVFPPARSFQNKRIQQRQKIRGRGRSRLATTPVPVAEATTIVTTVAPLASPPTEAPQSPSPSPRFSPGPSSRPSFSPGPSAKPAFSPGPSSTPHKTTPAHRFGPSPTPRRINVPTASLAPTRKRPPEVEALIRRFGPPQVEKPRGRAKGPPSFANLGPPPQPKIPPEVAALLRRFGPPRNSRLGTTARPQTTTTVSLFVTNPDFLSPTTTSSPREAPLPASAPTQNVPQSPFTASDMGLFVTNPRALPDHHKAPHNPFMQPPERSPDGRRPRVKSNIMAKLQNRAGPTAGPPPQTQPKEQTTERTVPVLRINPDGRTPRVKSNQRNKKKRNKKKNFRNRRKQFQRERTGRSQDIDADELNSVEGSDSDESDDYVEPELRPDGKKPRIKSNLKAKQLAKGNNQSGKAKKGGFRHSKRVQHHSSPPSFAPSTPPVSPEEGSDESNVAITTFRPTISLGEFANETSAGPPGKLSVPLPNFDKERFSEAVFQPTPRGFTRNEPEFSEKASVVRSKKEKMEVAVETATETLTVSSKDQNLFDSDYNYEDYYYDQINAQES